MALEELFSQLSLWMVNLSPKSYTFCLYFFHLTPEYGSNTDSDPQQCSIIFRKTAVGALIHFVTKNDPAIAFDTIPRIYLIYKKNYPRVAQE